MSTSSTAYSSRDGVIASKRWIRPVAVIVALLLLFGLPLVLPEFMNQTLARVGVFAVAVLGLNVVMGYTGQVSLGQIFFLGLGAYVTAYCAQQGMPLVVGFVLSMVIPGLVGVVIALAAARLGGLAIAMVTIALPIIGVPLAKRLTEFTGGSQGISAGIASPPDWLSDVLFKDQYQLYVVLLVALGAFLLTRNLVRGKYGRAFGVVKDNEAVASSMGISPYGYKVLAFTVAAIIGGLSGFLYMFVVEYTSPETLAFNHSITLLAAMIVGGAGSIVGSLIGGAYYVFVPQLANEINPNMTVLIQGVILLAVLFLLPGGIASLPRVLGHFGRKRGASGGGRLGTAILGVVDADDVAIDSDGPRTVARSSSLPSTPASGDASSRADGDTKKGTPRP